MVDTKCQNTHFLACTLSWKGGILHQTGLQKEAEGEMNLCNQFHSGDKL